jgi:hypothetical protein
MWTHPLSESAEITQWALYINRYSKPFYLSFPLPSTPLLPPPVPPCAPPCPSILSFSPIPFLREPPLLSSFPRDRELLTPFALLRYVFQPSGLFSSPFYLPFVSLPPTGMGQQSIYYFLLSGVHN